MSSTNQAGQVVLSPAKAARYLGVSDNQIYRLIGAKMIEATKNEQNGRWEITLEACEVYAGRATATKLPQEHPDAAEQLRRLMAQTDAWIKQVKEERARQAADIAALIAWSEERDRQMREAWEAVAVEARRLGMRVEPAEDRRQMAAIAVRRDQTAGSLAACAEQVAAMKRNAGVSA